MKTWTLLLITALALARGASAHEFWIEPDTFQPQPGTAFRVSLHHGERFLGAPVSRQAGLIDRFVLVGPEGERPVVGRDGALTSFARTDGSGDSVIVYRGRRQVNHMPPERFEDYLREEGLEPVIGLRADRGESDRPGREVYSRCAKALISTTETGHGPADRLLGLPLEILLEAAPGAGVDLAARVLFQGQPLGGARVVAVNRRDPHRLLVARSGEDGRVIFAGLDGGVWMLTTIHMVRAPADLDADWESFWSSLTFEAVRA